MGLESRIGRPPKIPDDQAIFVLDPSCEGEVLLGENMVCKTAKMLGIEERFSQNGEGIKKILERLYVENKGSQKEIGDKIGVSAVTVRFWLNHFAIRVRNLSEAIEVKWADPVSRRKWKHGHKQGWDLGPELKKERVDKIHNPAADAARLKGQQKWWNETRADLKKKAKISKSFSKARKKEVYSRLKSLLGGSPKRRLREMMEEEGLRPVDIAVRFSCTRGTVRRWCKRFGIEVDERARESLDAATMAKRKQIIKEAKNSGLFKQLTRIQQETLEALYPEKGQPPPMNKVAGVRKRSREGVRSVEKRALAKLEQVLS